MKRYTALLLMVFFLIGCDELRRERSESQNQQLPSTKGRTAPAPSATALPRFQPVGNNPEIALDTQRGTLCRTVAAEPGSADRYAKLPMCNVEEPPPERLSIDPKLWDSAILDASCYRTKNLLASALAADPSKKEVVPGCLIHNLTDKEQSLEGTDFDAVLRLPDGTTYRRRHVYLASSEKRVSPGGQIEGGLWVNHQCEVGQPDADCLSAALMGANDLLLTSNKTGIRYRVRMDRDSDLPGIRK